MYKTTLNQKGDRVLSVKLQPKDKHVSLPLFLNKKHELDMDKYDSQFNAKSWCFWDAVEAPCAHKTCADSKSQLETTKLSDILRTLFSTPSLPTCINVTDAGAKQPKKIKHDSAPLNMELVIPHLSTADVNLNSYWLTFDKANKCVELWACNVDIRQGVTEHYMGLPAYLDHLEEVRVISYVPYLSSMLLHKGSLSFSSSRLTRLRGAVHLGTLTNLLTVDYNVCALVPRPLANVSILDSLMLVEFKIKNFKNSIWPIRNETERGCKAILTLCGGKEIFSKALCTDTHEDKSFLFAFQTLSESVIALVEKLQTWNTSSLWLPTQTQVLSKLSSASEFDSIMGIAYSVSPQMQEETCIVLKPNGMCGFHMDKLVSLLDGKCFIVDFKWFRILPTESFNHLYPNCLRRPYGEEWFNYMTSGPVCAFRVRCFDMMDVRVACEEARKASQLPWTKNIVHCSANAREASENIEHFFPTVALPLVEAAAATGMEQ